MIKYRIILQWWFNLIFSSIYWIVTTFRQKKNLTVLTAHGVTYTACSSHFSLEFYLKWGKLSKKYSNQNSLQYVTRLALAKLHNINVCYSKSNQNQRYNTCNSSSSLDLSAYWIEICLQHIFNNLKLFTLQRWQRNCAVCWLLCTANKKQDIGYYDSNKVYDCSNLTFHLYRA